MYVMQVDDMYREAPIKNGNFDYVEFTRILKHGKKDKDDDWGLGSVTTKPSLSCSMSCSTVDTLQSWLVK